MRPLRRLSIFLMAALVGSANIYAQNNTRMTLRNRLPGAGGAQASLKPLRLNIRIFSVSNNRSRRTPASPPVIATNYRPSYIMSPALRAAIARSSFSAIINFGKNSPAAKAAIEAAIRHAAKNPFGEFTKADLEKVRKLFLPGLRISDITFCTCLKQLTYIELVCNDVTDISPLAGLTRLEHLSLACTHPTDITPLAGLTQLKFLDLGCNNLTDVSPLARLTQLTDLQLGGNNLTDVSALAGLTQLTDLRLNSNKITDVSALADFKQLRLLWLNNNQIADVSPLAKLTQLTRLRLDNNPDLTKAQIAELQKALPKCRIRSNAKK